MIRKGAWTAAVIVPALIAANFLPQICIYLLACASLLLFIVIFFLRKRLKNGSDILMLAGAFLLASTVYFINYEATFAPLRPLDGAEVSARVQFTKIDGNCFVSEVVDASCSGEKVRIPGKLRLLMFRTDAEKWDTADVVLRLSVTDDLSGYADRADGIYARAEVLDISGVSSPANPPVAAYFDDLRENVGTVLRQYVGGEEGGIACAILTGDRQYISDDTNVAFSRSGLSHIMAVSGMHLSVLCALIFAIGKFGLPRRVTAICAGAVIAVVCVLAGFSLSVLRAGIMSAITFSGLFFRRRGDPLNSLGIALSLLALCAPFSVLDAAYLLSGAATLGIVALSPVLERKFCRRLVPGGVAEKVVRSACTTIGASVFTLPVSVIYFGEISLVGIPAMLLATWPVTAALALAALLGMIFWVPFVGEFIAFLIKLCCELLLRITSFFSNASFAVIDMRWEPLLIWLGFCVVAAALWYVFRCSVKMAKYLRAAAAVLLIVCVTIGAVADFGKTELYVAEEGFSVLASGPDTVVVDCSSVYAADRAADYLHTNGIYSVSALAITSIDERASGGATAFLRRIGVESVFLPASAKGSEPCRAIIDAANAVAAHVVFISENTAFECGGVSLDLLALPAKTVSLGVSAKAGSVKVLFVSTGGNDVCQQLCLYCRNEIDADILVTGACSQVNDIYRVLINDVSPEITVVISSSRPDGSISEAERMRIIGSCSKLYQTGVDGNISTIIDSSGKISCQNR